MFLMLPSALVVDFLGDLKKAMTKTGRIRVSNWGDYERLCTHFPLAAPKIGNMERIFPFKN